MWTGLNCVAFEVKFDHRIIKLRAFFKMVTNVADLLKRGIS
jgi:hypothetical protein